MRFFTPMELSEEDAQALWEIFPIEYWNQNYSEAEALVNLNPQLSGNICKDLMVYKKSCSQWLNLWPHLSAETIGYTSYVYGRWLSKLEKKKYASRNNSPIIALCFFGFILFLFVWMVVFNKKVL